MFSTIFKCSEDMVSVNFLAGYAEICDLFGSFSIVVVDAVVAGVGLGYATKKLYVELALSS